MKGTQHESRRRVRLIHKQDSTADMRTARTKQGASIGRYCLEELLSFVGRVLEELRAEDKSNCRRPRVAKGARRGQEAGYEPPMVINSINFWGGETTMKEKTRFTLSALIWSVI
ncbi:MAG TPA: hypothetical protein VLG74_10595, partial [Blastocatellia bacterium]|nr:hypothetical protein [Blastocatellia bacterium]